MELSLYGKYAGRLKYSTDYLNKCSELELFNQVSSLYYPISMVEHYEKMINSYKNTGDEINKKYYEDEITYLNTILKTNNAKEYDEIIYALDYCILQTARFGTNVTYNPNGRIILTEEFKNWYDNWSLYIASMDDVTLAIYRTCCYEGKGFDKFKLDKSIKKQCITNEFNNAKPIQYKLTKKNIKQKLA